MLDLVRRLRARRYITGILSDQTDWLDQLDARYHFPELFDHVFTSFRLGKGKRDPSLFDSVLFIDDDRGNVARACSRGLRSHL
jgi:putative hydrolase of the HAD superfamily